MTRTETPSETDVLRFIVAMCSARDDEQLVEQVIDAELAEFPEALHASYLKVSLRVVVAQMFGAAARRLDHEVGPGFVDSGLQVQARDNESGERT